MNFHKHVHFSREYGESMFVLEEQHGQLLMSREEAEKLFVRIGHVLQDDDIERFSEEGSIDDQPE